MTSTLPPQNGTLPLPKISFSLPENVDPRDCEKYPNSPYCGGDLIQRIPLGVQAFFSQDSCNFTLNVSPIIAAIATPPIQLTIRSATPECNIPPPSTAPPSPANPYIQPPIQCNDGTIWAICDGGTGAIYSNSQYAAQQQAALDYANSDVAYKNSADQAHNTRNAGNIRYQLPAQYQTKNNGFSDAKTGYGLAFPLCRVNVSGRGDLPGLPTSWEEYVLIWDYEEYDNGQWIPKTNQCDAWINNIFYDDTPPCYARPTVPPPPKYPTKNKECCMCDCTSSDQLLKLILKNIGTLPANVPNTVLTVNGVQPSGTATVNSLTDLFAYTLTALDSILGEWEIPVTLTNTDFSNNASTNTKVVRLPNLAEAIAEMYSLQWQTHTINEILLNMLTRSMVETGNVKQIAFKNHAAITAMIDWMNFNHSDNVEQMDLLFTVNQKSMESTLQPSQQNVDVVRYTDKHNLMETLHTLLQSAAITRAVHYRVLPDDDNDASTTLKNDLVNLIGNNTDLQSTLQTVINTVQSNYQKP